MTTLRAASFVIAPLGLTLCVVTYLLPPTARLRFLLAVVEGMTRAQPLARFLRGGRAR